MFRMKSLACLLAFGLVSLGFGMSAQAGIIVTIGDAPGEAAARFGKTFQKDDGSSASQPGAASNQGTVRVNRTCRVAGSNKVRPCPQPKSPAVDSSGLPSEWQCRPIGDGVFYCDIPLFGAGADEGAGGYASPDDTWNSDEEEIAVMGCGGADSGLVWPLALVGLVAWRFGRRRSASGARGA
jgi:hypothetical protein